MDVGNVYYFQENQVSETISGRFSRELIDPQTIEGLEM